MSTDRSLIMQADKAVLRLAIGTGLSVLVAYGLALPMPYAVCVMAFLVLCKPGPPIPFIKGAILAVIIAALTAAGVLMVPVLKHYALTGIALTGALLYAMFLKGGSSPGAQTMMLAFAVTLIPVAGMAEPGLASLIGVTLAVGIATGVLVSSASHALFPDTPEDAPNDAPADAPAAADAAANDAAKPVPRNRDAERWQAMRATLVVLPVFVLALSNPAFYLPAIMKAVALSQQASSAHTSIRSAGRELVGSTVMGAWVAALLWFGLLLRPNLWMLMLWMTAAALWVSVRLFGIKATAMPPSFWKNAMVTMLILLGPAIEDSAAGKDVATASAMRITLFVGVALYAWATVWALERWRAFKSSAFSFKRN